MPETQKSEIKNKCVCVCACPCACAFSIMSDSFWPHGLKPTGLLSPWGFSRQEHWSGLLFLSPGDLPNPGIEPGSPAFQADALPSEPPGKLYVKYMKCSVTAGFCFGFGQMYYYYHQHVFFLNQVLVVCFVNSLFVYWVNLWPHNWSSTFSLWKTFWRMPQILNIFHYFIYIYIFFFHTGLSFCWANQVCLIVQWIKRSDDLF